MESAPTFIRLPPGDMASSDEAPCTCGGAMPVVKKVAGRVEDVVAGANGRNTVRFRGIFVNQRRASSKQSSA